MAFVPDAPVAERPTAGRFLPDRTAALTPRQQAEIPRAIGAPEPPRPAAPPTPGPGDYVKGAVEWALEMVAQATGGTVGLVGGTVGGLAGAWASGGTDPSTPRQRAQRLEESAVEGARSGTQAMRVGMRQLGLGPADEGSATPVGQSMIDATGKLMGQAPMLAAGPRGMVGMNGRQELGLQPALRAAGDATAAVATPLVGAVRQAPVKVVAAITPNLSPETVSTVKKAAKFGIDLPPDAFSKNKYSKVAGEVSRNVPLAGAGGEANAVAFNRVIARRIGAEGSDKITPAVFDEAMTRSGETIGRITEANPVPVTRVAPTVERFRAASRARSGDVAKSVDGYLTELEAKAAENGGVIPGTAMKEILGQLGRDAYSATDGNVRHALGELHSALTRDVNKMLKGQDAADLRVARQQYSDGLTIVPLINAAGDISPAAFNQAFRRGRQGQLIAARGRGGEMGDLAEVAQYMREPGTSLTAERGAVLATLAGGGYLEPVSVAATYAGANLYNRLGPRVMREKAGVSKGPEAPGPETPPPEPGLAQGFEDVPQGRPPAGEPPLGDLTPDRETASGVRDAAPMERGPAEGLVPAVDDLPPPLRPIGTFNPRPELNTSRAGPVRPAAVSHEAPARGLVPEEIPAVPGRPDLPDAMVAGGPAEVAATEATGAAMQAPDAALARRTQLAEVERVRAKAAESPEVLKVLEEHEKALAKQAAVDAEKARKQKAAGELRKAAGYATNPELKERLLKRALALEADEKVPTGKATEGMPKKAPAPAPKRPIPTGKATEVPVETIVAEDPNIPVGEAVEVTPDVVELGQSPQARYEALKSKLNEKGLSSAEYAEMERIDPSKATPEEASEAAARIGVPESWMQERRHMIKAGRSDAEIRTQHAWEKANDRLMQAYDWTMAGRDAENAIRDRVQSSMGRKFNSEEFNRRVVDEMNAEADRLEKDAQTPGTLAYKRREKKDGERATAAVKAMQKAEQDEIKIVSDEIDRMREQGRITEREFQDLSERIAREAEDLEDALDLADELISKKSAGYLRQFASGKPEAANTKFEVGQTYTDAKGQRAIYQADGTWKEVD